MSTLSKILVCALAVIGAGQLQAQTRVVSTLAGSVSGTQGSTDGIGLNALFSGPTAVAVDGSGIAYVTDTLGNTIRKVRPANAVVPAGSVTTLAGTAGIAGDTDAPGSAARFNYPTGIAVDAGGNSYVVDGDNGTIRKITPAGVVTTLAGKSGFTGIGGNGPADFNDIDGAGGAARFDFPTAIAVDPAGVLYVAEFQGAIRKITPSAEVTTLAGKDLTSGTLDATGAAARFYTPRGIAADRFGNVYVADTGNHTIRKITSEGVVTTLAGAAGAAGSADGTGSAARFNHPVGIVADASGTIYVADTGNDTIRMITAAGVVSTVAGVPGTPGLVDGNNGDSRFNAPQGIGVDGTGNLIIGDTLNNCIRFIAVPALPFFPSEPDWQMFVSDSGQLFSATGTIKKYTIRQSGLSAPEVLVSGLGSPRELLLSGGTILVRNALSNTVGVYTTSGATVAASLIPGLNGLSAIGLSGNNLLIASGPASGIGPATISQYLLTTGALVKSDFITGVGSPLSLAVSDGNLFVLEYNGPGAAGTIGKFDAATGAAINRSFITGMAGTPYALATAGSGLYVASLQSSTMVEYDAATGLGRDLFMAGPLSSPAQISAANGRLFVANSGSATVSEFDAVTGTPLNRWKIEGQVSGVAVMAVPTQPVSQSVKAGASVTFTADALGATSYQWNFNATPIAGATASSYSIGAAATTNAGAYTVTATNSLGAVTSGGAVLAVQATGSPAIAAQPQSQAMAAGSTLVLTVTSSGTVTVASDGAETTGVQRSFALSRAAATSATYQWYRNGVALAGATTATLLIPNVAAGNAGSYSCLVSNALGSALSNAAVVTVTTTADPGRLINLSVLSVVQGSLTLGYVIGGGGTSGSENLLIRATGPALALPPFNVPGVLSDPALTVIRQQGSVTVATNSGWGTPAINQSQVSAANSAVGAFALTNPASLDSALVTTLPVSVGGYTATVQGKTGGSGYALTEVYDATPSGTYTLASPRLINLSCLTSIAPGGTLTVGFVVGGSTAKTVLVRVSGPTLAAAPFNLAGTMADPQLTLQPLSNPSATLAQNTAWGGDSQLAAVAASVGAFAFASPTSNDSATVVTLSAGVPYTVQATSVSGHGGLVLVEIYEVP